MDRNSNIFLTGRAGVGKSTIIKKILDRIDKSVGGIFTPEIREDGKRKGFKIVDIDSGEEGILASVNQDEGPKISKYRVNLDDLDRFSDRILDAVEGKDVIVIDEVGKMEMYSDKFKVALDEAIESDKLLLATLHKSLVIRFGSKGNMFKVTGENRDDLPEELIKIIDY